jgi:hypothetical protein
VAEKLERKCNAKKWIEYPSPASSEFRIRKAMLSARLSSIVGRKLGQGQGNPGRFNVNPGSVIGIGPKPTAFTGAIPVAAIE